MWYENNVLTAILSFTIISIMLLILSAVPTFNLSPGAEKVLEMIITAIAAFVTGYMSHAIKDAVTTKSITTTEKSTNAPDQIVDSTLIKIPTEDTKLFLDVLNKSKKGE